MTTRGIAHHNNRGLVRNGELSQLQRTIEQLVCEGVPQSEIARQLGLKKGGVARHIEKVRAVRTFEAMQRMRRRA